MMASLIGVNAANSYQKFIQSDMKFDILVEDSLVNNREFQGYSNDDKQTFMGILYYIHHVWRKQGSFPSYLTLIVDNFAKGNSSLQLFCQYINTKYAWDGSHWWCFDKVWNSCTADDITLDGLVEDEKLQVPIKKFTFTHPLITRGCTRMETFLTACSDEIANFSDQAYSSILSRASARVFNMEPNKIPFHSKIVNLKKSTMQNYKHKNLFNLRLSYDPVLFTTPPVKSYIKALQCNNLAIANCIMHCGASIGQCLTIVGGPPQSGKSSFLQIIRSLYGPYASGPEQVNTVNNDHIKVFCIDDPKFLENEEAVRNHPCSHLVVTDNNSFPIVNKFGGRTVRYLRFYSEIEKDAVIENIAAHMSTRLQLGSFFGWCLHEYNIIRKALLELVSTSNLADELELLDRLIQRKESPPPSPVPLDKESLQTIVDERGTATTPPPIITTPTLPSPDHTSLESSSSSTSFSEDEDTAEATLQRTPSVKDILKVDGEFSEEVRARIQQKYKCEPPRSVD